MSSPRAVTESYLGKSGRKPSSVDTSPTVIFQLRQNPDGTNTFPFGSPSIEGFYGLPPELLAADARPALARVVKEDLIRVQALMSQCVAKMAPLECEFRINTPANGLRWMRARAVPFRQEDGAILWHGSFNDITSLRAEAAKSRRREKQVRTYVESAPVAIFTIDGEGRIASANPAARRMLGYDLRTLLRLTLFDLHLPADAPSVRDILAGLRLGREEYREFIWQRSDRQKIWVQLHCVRLSRISYLAFCHEITQRKQAEIELRDTREILASFIEYAPASIALLDRSMRYLCSSLMWRICTGLATEPLLGRCHYDLFPDLPPVWTDAYQRGLKGETVKGEDTWVRSNGNRIRLRWEVHPWKQSSGNDTDGIILVLEDVTTVRETQTQLEQAQKMEALGQLAGGIAHDFNNLLQVIQSNCEILESKLGAEHLGNSYLGEIAETTREAAGLTSHLLAFSRKQQLSPTVFDPGDVLSVTVKILRRALGGNIEFVLRQDERMWCIIADKDQFSQILMNLAVNARDAMPEGGTLTLTAHNEVILPGSPIAEKCAPGEYIFFTMQDTGVGMDSYVLEHMFEPFFTTKAVEHGTGLGLATVHKIVTAMGGRIWAESEVGVGSCFSVYIPRADNAVAAELLVYDDQDLRGDETLLVVDDEDKILRIVASLLSPLGYTVLTTDPTAAVEKLTQHQGTIDLLITDVMMPAINGPELCQKLTALCPSLRTMYMSAYVDEASVKTGLLESSPFMLRKPFTFLELAGAVRQALTDSS
ncbi:MAG: PAS domain S-box protein [Candidatus Korobacteraceae bacterium]